MKIVCPTGKSQAAFVGRGLHFFKLKDRELS